MKKILILLVIGGAASIDASDYDPYSRSTLFYSKDNPFYTANELFNRSAYNQAITAYNHLLSTQNATHEQRLLAHNALGQAYRAIGDLGRGYQHIAYALNSFLKKPLLKDQFEHLKMQFNAGQLAKKPRLIIWGAESSRRFGVGDQLSDGIYAKMLTQLGIFNTVEIVAPVVNKLHTDAGCADEVLNLQDFQKNPFEYDYELFLFALPHILGVNTTADIAQQQYLVVDERRYEYWKAFINQKVPAHKIPIIIWWRTSSFPVPEGRMLSQRNVPLHLLTDLARKYADRFIFFHIQRGHAPLTVHEFDNLADNQKEDRALDVVTQAQKDAIYMVDDLFDSDPFQDSFALAQVILHDRKGFAIGPDTSLPNALSYAICQQDGDIRRICMLLAYNSDARWGMRASLPKGSRIPNVMEFWQQHEGDWVSCISQLEHYILTHIPNT